MEDKHTRNWRQDIKRLTEDQGQEQGVMIYKSAQITARLMTEKQIPHTKVS